MQDSKQYILPLFDNSLYPLDNFINSLSNQTTYETIKNWQIKWGIKPYEFILLVYGPPSSGKTYLTKIWQHLSKAFAITEDLSVVSEEIIRQYDAFIMEDIERLEERKILHFFNLINESRKFLLMTTGSFINNFSLPDLSSRINSSLKLEIKQPDDELMKKLIFKYFSDHSIRVNEQVLTYLLINLPRQFELMIKLLEKIIYFALAHKHAVTISLVKNVLNIQRHVLFPMSYYMET